MTDFGTDFACFSDLDQSLRMIGGLELVKQAVFHRLTTKDLLDVEDFGIDVREYLGRGLTAANVDGLRSEIEEVAERDIRVEEATVKLRLDGNVLTIDLSCVTSEGPFRLVLSVTALTVQDITGDANG
jgi:hypothetical protein